MIPIPTALVQRTLALCLAAGLGAALLAGCQSPPPPMPEPYRVGGASFDLTGAEVLQTWPILPFRTPPHFVRVALQMPPATLAADLPNSPGAVIQIDILAPQEAPMPDRVLATSFTDWSGREVAAAGTRYHYDPKSNLLRDGGRAIYVRRAAAAGGLEILEPPAPRGKAPEFFLQRSGDMIAAAIDCRDVPPQYGVGEYCSLGRQIGADYGYRVLFRRDLLPQWARIDAAARDYLARAAARGGS